MTAREAILFNIATDPSIPRNEQPTEMDYIRAIIKYLDERGGGER